MTFGPILISACLAGIRTRYDGGTRAHPRLKDLNELGVLVPVCPEILGGLGIPRPRCRFTGGDGIRVLEGSARVIDTSGRDCTSYFMRGAEEAKRVVELVSPRLILFKEGSPSCGVRRVDVGGSKEHGCGVTTALLRNLGIPIVTEDDALEEFI